MTSHIQTESRDGILKIRFNRIDKKNAVTLEMYRAMTEALKEAELDPTIRVAFFCGHRDCFTSGNDIQDFINSPPQDETSPVLSFLKAIMTFKKVMVAAVSGIALGLGTTMLLHCDLIYCSTRAKFKFPFVDLGLCPEAGSTYLLPQLVGYQQASELLLLAEAFGAERALKMGLINGIYSPEELEEKAWEKALILASKAPKALLMTKALLQENKIAPTTEAMRTESRNFLELLGGPEAQEAFRAFIEKRRPKFF